MNIISIHFQIILSLPGEMHVISLWVLTNLPRSILQDDIVICVGCSNITRLSQQWLMDHVISGNNTSVRHSDMSEKMSSKSEKLPNLPDKMSEECYGTKIVISHHQLLVFCLNKTIQTTFHYGRKWRLLTVMACLITNAAFKLFKSVHTHATILQSCQLKCLP